jgi:hypothetical protein
MVLTLRIAPSQINSDCRVDRTAPEPPWPETPILRRPNRLFWIEGAWPSTRVRWAPWPLRRARTGACRYVGGWCHDGRREEQEGGPEMSSAPVETLTQRPALRNLLSGNRCLMPANGFHEWKVKGEREVPHDIHPIDAAWFACAGLYKVSTPRMSFRWPAIKPPNLEKFGSLPARMLCEPVRTSAQFTTCRAQCCRPGTVQYSLRSRCRPHPWSP